MPQLKPEDVLGHFYSDPGAEPLPQAESDTAEPTARPVQTRRPRRAVGGDPRDEGADEKKEGRGAGGGAAADELDQLDGKRAQSFRLSDGVILGLRLAAARKSDPRGRNMSAIVEALCRENGYVSDDGSAKRT
jgi:hypothetical protein